MRAPSRSDIIIMMAESSESPCRFDVFKDSDAGSESLVWATSDVLLRPLGCTQVHVQTVTQKPLPMPPPSPSPPPPARRDSDSYGK